MDIDKEIVRVFEELPSRITCPVLLEKLYELVMKENAEREVLKMKIEGLNLVETIIDKLGLDGSQTSMNIFAKPPHQFGLRMKNGSLCVELIKPTIILRKPYNLRNLLNPPNPLESVLNNPKSGESWMTFMILSGALYYFLYKLSVHKFLK